jgi:hypothetical protein
MAVYKVWLTVKDGYGNEKEIEAGNIVVDFELSPEDISQIEEALPLGDYLKKQNIETDLKDFATDTEVAQAVMNTVKYSEFKIKQDEAGN